MNFDCKLPKPMYDKFVDGGMSNRKLRECSECLNDLLDVAYGYITPQQAEANLKRREREASREKRRELVLSIKSKCLRLFEMFR